MRRLLSLLFASLGCLVLDAHASYLDSVSTPSGYRRYVWSQDSIVHSDMSYRFYPSAMAFRAILPPNRVGIHAEGYSSMPKYYEGTARSLIRYGGKADGLLRVSDFTLHGAAIYRRKAAWERQYILTSQAEELWPYVLSDTTSCTLWGEQYGVSFGASYPLGDSFSIGIGALYDGQLEYSRQDPRIKNTLSRLNGGLALTYHSQRLGLLSLAWQMESQMQDAIYTVHKVNSRQLVYYLRPLGAINHRYTASSDGGGLRHLQLVQQLGLQWMHQKLDMALGLHIAMRRQQEESGDPGAIPAEVQIYSLSPTFHLSLPFPLLGSHLWLEGRGFYIKRYSVERVYEYVKASESLTVMNAKLLTERPGFSGSESLAILELHGKRKFSTFALSSWLAYRFSLRDTRSDLSSNFLNAMQQYASLSIAAQYHLPIQGLLGLTRLSWGEQVNRNLQYQLEKNSPVAKLYTHRAERFIGARRQISIAQSFDLIPSAWKGQGLRLICHAQLLYWHASASPNLEYSTGIEYHF